MNNTTEVNQDVMTTQEIYKLASEMTEQEVLNIVGGWEHRNEKKCISTFNSLVRSGDSKQLACVKAIAEQYNKKQEKNKMNNTTTKNNSLLKKAQLGFFPFKTPSNNQLSLSSINW